MCNTFFKSWWIIFFIIITIIIFKIVLPWRKFFQYLLINNCGGSMMSAHSAGDKQPLVWSNQRPKDWKPWCISIYGKLPFCFMCLKHGIWVKKYNALVIGITSPSMHCCIMTLNVKSKVKLMKYKLYFNLWTVTGFPLEHESTMILLINPL